MVGRSKSITFTIGIEHIVLALLYTLEHGSEETERDRCSLRGSVVVSSDEDARLALDLEYSYVIFRRSCRFVLLERLERSPIVNSS